ncbi:MAG TPA: hypothetical protein VFU03_02780 [Gemmatimonadales bacterium]|nr:hypothetical protein [Gemmatimonadales bacterium]
MKGASVRAVLAGAGAAALLGMAAGFLLWPRLIAAGVLDLEQFNHRMLYILAGALPALLGGYIAGRMAPDRPVAHGIAVGVLLLIPMLVALPAVLKAYHEVPQSPLPMVLAWVMRPVAGAAGAYLTGRVETAPPS